MTNHTITMNLAKSTKGTHVYEAVQAEGRPNAIVTIYVQKWALSSPPPSQITITLNTNSSANPTPTPTTANPAK